MRTDYGRGSRTAAALFCLLILVVATERAAAQTLPDDSIRRIMETRIARAGAVGLVAGTVTGGGSARVVAAGTRAGSGTPAPAGSTVFEIGSVSKVFTTLLLAEMVARGEVSLDDPVARYLPASVRVPARDGREITLLDLATATSGLPRLPTNIRPADMTTRMRITTSTGCTHSCPATRCHGTRAHSTSTRIWGWVCSAMYSHDAPARRTRPP